MKAGLMAQVLLDNTAMKSTRSTDGRSVRVPCGILVVDKPEGLTSFSVVKKVQKWLRLEKAGHCGTLDPFATGALLICVNQATRISDLLSLQSKRYLATLELGIETDTLDRTGEVVGRYQGEPIRVEGLSSALQMFRGTFMQQVPQFAAVHVAGRRMYEYARNGIQVDAPVREVCVHNLELTAFEWPFATLDISCSKGTYVRQLGADVGRHLGCGAHLSSLRRLESGPFRIEQAVSFNALSELKNPEEIRGHIVPMSEALDHLPRVVMDDEGLLKRLQVGSIDSPWEETARKVCSLGSTPVRSLDGSEALRALWWPNQQEEQGRRLRVFGN